MDGVIEGGAGMGKVLSMESDWPATRNGEQLPGAPARCFVNNLALRPDFEAWLAVKDSAFGANNFLTTRTQ